MRRNRRDKRAAEERRDLPADLWEYLQPFVAAEPHPGPDWYIAAVDEMPTISAETQPRGLVPAPALRLQLES
jgi:hypothetical protein